MLDENRPIALTTLAPGLLWILCAGNADNIVLWKSSRSDTPRIAPRAGHGELVGDLATSTGGRDFVVKDAARMRGARRD